MSDIIDVEQYPLIYITNNLPWYSYRDDYYYRTTGGHSWNGSVNRGTATGNNPTTYQYNGDHIVSIYKIGVPSILMQSIGSVTTFCMNNILLMFSATAATVFGVYFKLQSFIFMPVFGLTKGMIPMTPVGAGPTKGLPPS